MRAARTASFAPRERAPQRAAVMPRWLRSVESWGLALLALLLAGVSGGLLWALGLGGVATTLSPAINARQLLRNGAILFGLYLLYRGLVMAGVPAARSDRTVAA